MCRLARLSGSPAIDTKRGAKARFRGCERCGGGHAREQDASSKAGRGLQEPECHLADTDVFVTVEWLRGGAREVECSDVRSLAS